MNRDEPESAHVSHQNIRSKNKMNFAFNFSGFRHPFLHPHPLTPLYFSLLEEECRKERPPYIGVRRGCNPPPRAGSQGVEPLFLFYPYALMGWQHTFIHEVTHKPSRPNEMSYYNIQDTNLPMMTFSQKKWRSISMCLVR
jgi:hypothetical protein